MGGRCWCSIAAASLVVLMACGGGADEDRGGTWECLGESIPVRTKRHAEATVEFRPVAGEPFTEVYSGACAGTGGCVPWTAYEDEGHEVLDATFGFDEPRIAVLEVSTTSVGAELEAGTVPTYLYWQMGDDWFERDLEAELSLRQTKIGVVYDVAVTTEFEWTGFAGGPELESIQVHVELCAGDVRPSEL